jgi:hypothetical protein
MLCFCFIWFLFSLYMFLFYGGLLYDDEDETGFWPQACFPTLHPLGCPNGVFGSGILFLFGIASAKVIRM